MEELLTIEDVCRLFKFKKSYLYHLTHRGKVPHIKIGNHVRFKQSSLEEWLSEQTQEANPDEKETGHGSQEAWREMVRGRNSAKW